MNAPTVRLQGAPTSTAHAVTVSGGPRKNAIGTRCPLAREPSDTPARQLAYLLGRISPNLEAWWSPHTWEGNHRDGSKWLAAAALAVDVDYHDGDGKHATPPPEISAQLEQAVNAGELPGNLFHLTPRGARVVFLPSQPVTDRALCERATEGACIVTRQALETLGLYARQAGDRLFRDGYAVDEAATDCARFLYAPRAIVNGEQRDAPVLVIREDFADVAALAENVPPPPAPQQRTAPVRALRASTELTEAVERWNADHPADWGKPGAGECPACGHKGCFGRLPAIPDKWCCFSTNHEAGSGGVGWQSGKGRWIGDALDLEAHHSNRRRVEVLRADGYLVNGQPQGRDTAKSDAAAGPTRSRPSILLRNELGPVTDEAETALLADPDAGIYVRARQLVRVVRDPGKPRGGLLREPDAPVIHPLPLDALRERIDRAAEWVRFNEHTKKEHPVLPPEWVARTLAARGAWRFPYLDGVIEAPTLKPDGTLLDAPGYDAGSGLMLIPPRDFPAIPEHPTRQDALGALARLREPFADFPFLDKATDLATAVAAVLSLVARYAIDGPVPLFAVRAPAPGTGKGLLADVVCLIGTGRTAARTTLPREDAELRKVILTVAMEGAPAVLLDNVDRVLGSESLASALTATEWEDRLLGMSARVRAPLRAVWVATGNGLTFKGDLGRRVLPIDLDAGVEHPEDRDGFKHPDLIAWTRQHRPRLLADALTLLRAYQGAGRPPHGRPRKGSFESWDDVVRGACVWVGLGDPVAGTERVRREDDSDLAALAGALEAWHEAFAATPQTAAQAVAAAGEGTPLRDALLGLTGRDKLETRSLGYALRKTRGRIVNGLRFTTSGEQQGGLRWTVTGGGSLR